MEAVHRASVGYRLTGPIAKPPSLVILALDHFTPEERAAIDRVVYAFMRGEAPATRLPDPEPFYLLRATPNVLVIVRHESGRPMIIEDVVTQEAWDHLAHAG
ncbi:MAG: hypothetical protein ACRDGS_06190 [Chloroflexota bacterium]